MGEALSLLEGPEGQAQDLGAAGSAQESVLLSQLIQLLHQRERHSLLLSDLGALLPTVLRQRVKDQGGLRSWLQRYPSLFAVVGQPGKESVTLCLGAAMQHIQPGASPAAMAAAVEPLAWAANNEAEAAAAAAAATAANGQDVGEGENGLEEDSESLSAVQLRGLPYRANLEDIVTFLGEHSSDLAESNAVQLVQNRDGRPSGFARVQFNSPESAKKCVNDLHLRSMEDRYVEVFLFSERPSKGRQRRGGHEDGTAPPGEVARLAAAVDASGVTREQVVRECRMQMADIKNRKLLLSMLGVALSPGARSYLKQMDQGLKHFLSQFPNEFSVDGGKGCEYVNYTPTQLSLSQAIDGFDSSSPGDALGSGSGGYGRAARGADELGSLTASPKAMSHAAIAASPGTTTGPASGNRGINTPSDWGTPAPWPGGGAQPWAIPPWPNQGVPGALPSDTNPPGWGNMPMPAWPMPPPQYGWGGWPSYPYNMEGAPPPNAADATAAAAAFGAAGGAGMVPPVAQPPSAAPQVAAAQQQAVPAAAASPSTTAVRLRGLPFTSVEQDVLAFFAQHDIVDRIADGPKAVNILTRSNGRPSGQAIVQMREPQDAELAQGVLHGQWMGSRYIEVFLMAPEENEAQGGAPPGTSPTKAGHHEPISLAMGVPAPTAAPPASQQLNGGFSSATGPAPDLGGGFPGMAGGMPPPWQLGMWSAAMAGSLGAPPPLGPTDFGGGVEANSWEALFEFLGPEGSAAAMAGLPPPTMDLTAMGYGMPPPVANGSGVPTANGAPAAAAV